MPHLLQQAQPEGHSSGTFLQRVFVCSQHWTPAPDGTLGPIFFYLGNEADVTL
jgi:lysosomal Pro-X carboxypeptidase